MNEHEQITLEQQAIQKNLIALAYDKMWPQLLDYLTPAVLQEIRLDYYDGAFIEHLIYENQHDILQTVLKAIQCRAQKDNFILASTGPLYLASKKANWDALDILYNFLSQSTNISFFMQAEDIFYVSQRLPQKSHLIDNKDLDIYPWNQQHKLVFLKCILSLLPVKLYQTPTEIEKAMANIIRWTYKHNYTCEEVSVLLEQLVISAVKWDNLALIQYMEEKLQADYQPKHKSYIETVMRQILKHNHSGDNDSAGSYWYSRYYEQIQDNTLLSKNVLKHDNLKKIHTIKEEQKSLYRLVPQGLALNSQELSADIIKTNKI